MTAPGDKTDTSSAAENTSSITGTNNNALLASPEDVLTAEEVIERLEELEHDAAEVCECPRGCANSEHYGLNAPIIHNRPFPVVLTSVHTTAAMFGSRFTRV